MGQPGSFLPPDEAQVRLRQQELFEIQKRPEACDFVLPLLDHEGLNVFLGAHTVQVRIARDWRAVALP